jgi:hypothetical protein
MRLLAWIAISALALFLLDRLALWAEARGWLYYRRRTPSSSSVGNAFLEVQSLLEPSKREVVEIRREEHVEAAIPGEPPPEDDAAEERDP